MICAIPSVCNKSLEMSTMLFRLLLSAENGKILCIATMASYLNSGKKNIIELPATAAATSEHRDSEQEKKKKYPEYIAAIMKNCSLSLLVCDGFV